MKNLFLKLLLGIAAAAPLLCVAAVIAFVVIDLRPTALPIVQILFGLVVASMLLFGVALGYFLYVVQRETSLNSDAKTRWTLIMLLWFPFGAIAFWYRFIWRMSQNGQR